MADESTPRGPAAIPPTRSRISTTTTRFPAPAVLVLSPHDDRLVCSVQTLSPDGTSFQTSLWDVDPAGVRPARRLTRSAAGESAPAFTPDGDVLFISKRVDDAKKSKDAEDVAALWCLPSAGGDPRKVVAAPGPLTGVYVASGSGTVVVTGNVLPGPADTDGDRRKARKEAGVSALLHETTPVRHWDHDLGPDEVRLFVVEPCADAAQPAASSRRGAARRRFATSRPPLRRGLDEAVGGHQRRRQLRRRGLARRACVRARSPIVGVDRHRDR